MQTQSAMESQSQTPTSTMGQTVPMPTPPQVITTKDLMFLKDAMSWMLIAMKKCAHYSDECNDSAVKQQLDQLGQMHQRHYQLLLAHCDANNTQAMSKIPQPPQAQ